jgi:membrane protein implicated in regulation of membrane protease activity
METLFWIWLAAAGVFLIAELVNPTLLFICFMVGAIVAAVLAQVWPDAYYWQITAFAILSSLLIPFTRRFAGRISKEAPELSNVDRMIGQVALVTAAVDPDTGGKVKFEGEIWQAKAKVAIGENEKVRITAVSGTRVEIEKLD